MKQQNIRPWISASDVTNAVNEIIALMEESGNLPKARLEHYGILAVISELEYKNLFLKMLEERSPGVHPQFVRYLHKLAENGRKYSREYRTEMNRMTNRLGHLYGVYGDEIFLRMKKGRRVSSPPPREDALMNCT